MSKLLPVTKKVSDYTEKELKQFYEQFVPLAQRHRHLNLRLKIIMALSFGLIIIFGIVLWGIVLNNFENIPEWLPAIMLFLVLLLPLIVYILFVAIPLSRLDKCPSCNNHLSLTKLGDYCPECGKSQFDKSNWVLGPKCKDCGKWLKYDKRGRHYKIRFCTHCGVFLDENGF